MDFQSRRWHSSRKCRFRVPIAERVSMAAGGGPPTGCSPGSKNDLMGDSEVWGEFRAECTGVSVVMPLVESLLEPGAVPAG